MNKLFLILFAGLLTGAALDAQQMQWVPGDQVNDSSYTDGTNCAENVLCYALAYTPAQTGVLTSYTTNFLVDCDSGNSAVVNNTSLVMTDNSAQHGACAEYGKLLMHSSGNSGTITVKAGRTTFLHEICLQTTTKTTALRFESDQIGGMTTSLDVRDQPAVTERPVFAPFLFKRDRAACDDTPASVFSDVDLDTPTAASLERDGSGLTISPNPATTEISVRFAHAAATADFRILDATGKEVRTWTAATDTRLTVNIAGLPAGLYYLSAHAEEESLTEKFVIRK